MVKHDENKDLRSFSRIGKVDYSDKTLQCAKSAIKSRLRAEGRLTQ